VAASGAFRAVWPAQAGYGVNADLRIGVVPDGFLKCLWLFHENKVAD